MSKFTNETQGRFAMPSYEEVDRLIAQAHGMRNAAIRDMLVRFWNMLRRSVSRKPALRHA